MHEKQTFAKIFFSFHYFRVKRKSLGADLMASGGKIIKMGNPELTRLWNLCPDNNEACKSEKR